MSTIRVKDLKSMLKAKGFEEQSTHHSMFWLYVDGKKTSIRTRISHGKKEYDSYLTGQVAKQMKLSRQELDEFVECTFSAEMYRAKMLEEGHVKG